MSQPSTDAVSAKLKKNLPKIFRDNLKRISRLDLLTMDTPILTKISELDKATVLQLKTAMLTAPFKAPKIPKQVKAVQKAKAKSSKRATPKKSAKKLKK